MIIGVPKETFPGERRVSCVPGEIASLKKQNHQVLLESGAGVAAGYPDRAYTDKGASLASSRAALFAEADLIVQVRGFGANLEAGAADLALLAPGKTLIAFLDPLAQPQAAAQLAATGVHALAMELVPRITRAQAMDALSSMANLAGYKSVLIGAQASPRILPMMMTAAGTLAAAKVLVLGAGVAGLQAIATAKRLGAVVEAYDIRPEVKEQVQSVGGKFVQLDLDTTDASGGGGYAKAQSEAFYRKQQELLAAYVRNADIIITTAAVPGRRAPILITREMLSGAKPGAVLVDLAADTGGNCELTRPGETYEHAGVTMVGPLNVPSSLPFHASQLYARNITALVRHISTPAGALQLNLEDEITRETLLAQNGKVVHPRLKQA